MKMAFFKTLVLSMSAVQAASTSVLGGPLNGLSITRVASKRTRSFLTALAAGAEPRDTLVWNEVVWQGAGAVQ